MVRLDPLRSLRPIDDLLGATVVPYHRRLLENFREHVIAEVVGDIDRIMATMAPRPVYHSYDSFGDSARADEDFVIVNGRDETWALYREFIDSGRHIHELDSRRLAVSDWGIAGDGYLYLTERGSSLAAEGVPGIAAGATYVSASRFAYFIPYKDGMMAGEDIYRPRSNISYLKVEPHEMLDREVLRKTLDLEASGR
jgi:hypothetical protein